VGLAGGDSGSSRCRGSASEAASGCRRTARGGAAGGPVARVVVRSESTLCRSVLEESQPRHRKNSFGLLFQPLGQNQSLRTIRQSLLRELCFSLLLQPSRMQLCIGFLLAIKLSWVRGGQWWRTHRTKVRVTSSLVFPRLKI